MLRIVFIGLFIGLTWAYGQEETFQKGNKAYAEGDYETAVAAYNQLVAAESRSSDLYYNLGNTYYRLNEWGKAVWAYERALEIDPSHVNTHYNLDFVNQLTKAELMEEDSGVGRWLKANLFGISINFWPWFSLISSVLFAASIYFFFTTKRQKIKNISLSASISTFFLLMGGIVLAALNTSQLKDDSKGIIIINTSNVFAEPSENSNTIFPLKEGAKVQILRSNSEWVEIDFKGHSGWVAREEIWAI